MPQRRLIRRWSGCRHPARILRDESGVTIVEYALLAPMFIALLIGILCIALTYLAQEGLETAAEGGARLFMTGLAQTGTVTSNNDVGMSAADFQNAICNGTTITDGNGNPTTIPPSLPPYLNCGNLTFNVVPAPSNILSATGVPAYNCYGQVCNSSGNPNAVAGATAAGSGLASTQNTVMVVQLFYNWRMIGMFGLSGLGLTGSNAPQQLVATSVFTTENYCPAGQATC